MTEDEMVGWYYWCTGHEFQQPLGDSEGQGTLACYSPWVDCVVQTKHVFGHFCSPLIDT